MINLKNYWWKILILPLMLYVVWGGLMFEAPRLPVLNETVRALHFHVPMWFGMVIMLLVSVIYSIRNLGSGKLKDDIKAETFVTTGIIFGILGLLTGMVWANYTWGAPWSNDPKQNTSAIGLLIYFAYMILRKSLTDEQQRARLASVYNIFAFVIFIVLIFVLPRLTDSLHPGNGGNPGFNSYDLDNRLRLVFYPAVIGWTLLGVWITNIRIRMKLIKQKIEEQIF